MKPILECQGLSKRYSSSFYALNNLNLALEKGQIVGLLGHKRKRKDNSD